MAKEQKPMNPIKDLIDEHAACFSKAKTEKDPDVKKSKEFDCNKQLISKVRDVVKNTPK